MGNFQFNYRIIRFVYDDILKLYARFGYDEFLSSDTLDLNLNYSMKKLSNYAVVGKNSRDNGRIKYKLSKYVVERCQKVEERYNA